LGRAAHTWRKDKIMDVDNWYYIFYADKETLEPIRLFQHGLSIRGSHATDYVFDFEEFGPTIDETAFYIPTYCHNISTGGPSKNARKHRFSNDISSLKQTNVSNFCPMIPTLNGTVPEEFSWRDHPGVLSMPRDQASCGSCWAQAAANAISSQFALRTNSTTHRAISVQQIVDCTWGLTNYACDGGETDQAFQFMIDNRTIIVPEDEYPYLGVAGKCQNTTHTNQVTKLGYVSKCWETPQKNEEQLKLALYQKGPIAVAILASLPSFSKYQGGLYDDPQCNSDAELDHCVLLTGWKKFGDDWAWEIQNSWSDTWGDHGYGYIRHGFDHDCGVTMNAFLPVIELY